MTTYTTNKQTATDAYVAAHFAAQDLLKQVQDLLWDRPAPDGEVPINWSHVGDLNHLNSQLTEIVVFLRGCK